MEQWPEQLAWWLYHDPNAPGLIQAFTAIVTAVLTGWLIVVTRLYTRLTKESVVISGKLAEIAAKQLATSVQPELIISFTNPLPIKGLGNQTLLATTLEIQNAGDSPVKLHKVLACVLGPNPTALCEIPLSEGKVVLPGGLVSIPLQLETGVTSSFSSLLPNASAGVPLLLSPDTF